jgi:hypothetical protein
MYRARIRERFAEFRIEGTPEVRGGKPNGFIPPWDR